MDLRRFEAGRWGAIAGIILARISHHPSTATVLCRALHDFNSVRALNIVSVMLCSIVA